MKCEQHQAVEKSHRASRDSRHTKLVSLRGIKPWEDDASEEPDPPAA
jgi:hypothetical protein